MSNAKTRTIEADVKGVAAAYCVTYVKAVDICLGQLHALALRLTGETCILRFTDPRGFRHKYTLRITS